MYKITMLFSQDTMIKSHSISVNCLPTVLDYHYIRHHSHYRSTELTTIFFS